MPTAAPSFTAAPISGGHVAPRRLQADRRPRPASQATPTPTPGKDPHARNPVTRRQHDDIPGPVDLPGLRPGSPASAGNGSAATPAARPPGPAPTPPPGPSPSPSRPAGSAGPPPSTPAPTATPATTGCSGAPTATPPAPASAPADPAHTATNPSPSPTCSTPPRVGNVDEQPPGNRESRIAPTPTVTHSRSGPLQAVTPEPNRADTPRSTPQNPGG